MALDAVYLETILEHYKRPRNMERPERWDAHARGSNPACGDEITVFLDLEGDRLQRVRFEGTGCAISLSSASMMTEALSGKSLEAAERFRDSFLELMEGEGAPEGTGLGELEALGGVRALPARVRCATLAWEAFTEALRRVSDGQEE